MLHVGDRVPDFTLRVGTADGRRDPVRFSSLLGKGPIVLAFYPLAFTGVCTREVCELRDHAARLADLDATVFGFSIDSAPTNAAFAKAQGLSYGLFCDPNREVVDTLWETMEVVGVRRAAKRGFLVVTRDGVVAEKWVGEDPEQWPGVAVIEAALAKLQ